GLELHPGVAVGRAAAAGGEGEGDEDEEASHRRTFGLGSRHLGAYKPPLATITGIAAMRKAEVTRKTAETEIAVRLDLDGSGTHNCRTGVGFFDHMLDQLARHSLFDLEVRATGDLHIDDHHTVEDVGIAIGRALAEALGDKRGIRRYGACLLPMDEALVRAALDLSGRPFLVWKLRLDTPKIGSFDTELVREFFTAFAMNAGMTLHLERLDGANSHHVAEAAFKAVARALREAVEPDPRAGGAVPSTKGTLA